MKKYIETLKVTTERDWTLSNEGTKGHSGTCIESLNVVITYNDGTIEELSKKFKNGEFSDDHYALASMVDINVIAQFKAVSKHQYLSCSLWYDEELWTRTEEPEEEPEEQEEQEEGTDIMTKYYDENSAINIYVANLAAYNNGELLGAWVSLPATEEQIHEVFDGIKGGYDDFEYAIHDYETSIGLEIDEYASIDKLNELAEELEALSDYELKTVKAYIEANGGTLRESIESIDRCIFYEGITLEDLAAELVEDGYYGEISEQLKSFLDYEHLANELSITGYTEVNNGVIYTR